MTVGRVMIAVGAVILVAGILVQLGVPLGRLPGDIRLSRGSVTVYAPLVTGLIVSVVLTILVNLLIRR